MIDMFSNMTSKNNDYIKEELVMNPNIYPLVDVLVKTRCSVDISQSDGPYRHVSAIFVEKNQSCFQCDIEGHKSSKHYTQSPAFKS